MESIKKFILIIIAFIFPILLSAKDIYVKAGQSRGRGNKEAPYSELWLALSKAVRGDVIHVAKGKYHAKGGSGNFTIKIPQLTLVGGYNDDFSKRNPFKYFTILERAKDYKGDWTGLKEGIIEGIKDHTGLIVDGFVLNSESRNSYYKGKTKINPKKSWKGALFRTSSPNVKLRNSILLNPYGNGIYSRWYGKKNEISNNFILNTFYAAISTRSAQPNSKILIKNNTVMFSWFRPGKGGAFGVFVGSKGQTIIENNIFGFLQTEGGEAGIGVINGFGNEDTILKNNIFFQCQGGYYKYMDADGKNLLVWKKDEFESMSEDSEEFMLLEAQGNSENDPQLKPDKWYFEKFANFIASSPGKLKMNSLNRWRRNAGIPLHANKGTARQNWGMPYPLSKVVPFLISPTKKGAQKIRFQKYKSSNNKTAKKGYKDVDFQSFLAGGPAKVYTGQAVQFKAGIGRKNYHFVLEEAPRSDYECYQLILPGERSYTRKYVYGYFLKGSKAHKRWLRYYKKARRYNRRGGVVVRGSAYYLGKESYRYPIGIIVDKVSRR